MEPFYCRDNDATGAEAIIFVHGGGISGQMWEESLKQISEYQCLAPDLPGHGQSAHISPLTLDQAADGLADLIRSRVPSSRVSVVAISVGVSISLGLLERHPELVEKAFLSGPTPRFGRIATSLMNTLSRPFLSLMGAEQRVQFVARSLGLTDQQIDVFRDDLSKLTPELVLQINDVVAGQGDPGPDSPPMIVLAGERELGAVRKRTRQIVSAAGNSRGYIVRDLGHAWCLEDPELFRQTVRAWMSNAELGDRFTPLPA